MTFRHALIFLHKINIFLYIWLDCIELVENAKIYNLMGINVDEKNAWNIIVVHILKKQMAFVHWIVNIHMPHVSFKHLQMLKT